MSALSLAEPPPLDERSRRRCSRMRGLEIGTYGDYLSRVLGGGDEWERLVVLLVVPESRFFRSGAGFQPARCRLHFDALMTRVPPTLRDRRPAHGIHLKSIGCARGREARIINQKSNSLGALLKRLRPGGYLVLAVGELVSRRGRRRSQPTSVPLARGAGSILEGVGARPVPFPKTLCYRRRKEAVHVQIFD